MTTLTYDASGDRLAASSHGVGTLFGDGAQAIELALLHNDHTLIVAGTEPGDDDSRDWSVVGYRL